MPRMTAREADDKYFRPPSALCWSCTKSATTKDKSCSWNRELLLPEGAEVYEKNVRLHKKEKSDLTLKIILKCPEYEEMPERGREEEE